MDHASKTFGKGKDNKDWPNSVKKSKPNPRVILPLQGRFKGERGERCHLIPFANETRSGLKPRAMIEMFVLARKEMGNIECNWAFVNQAGEKLEFGKMNDIILERLEIIKEGDQDDSLGLKELDIREDFSINRSFRRGSTTHAQNRNLDQDTINANNRWRKINRAKGRKAKLDMIEEYSDIVLLMPTLV